MTFELSAGWPELKKADCLLVPAIRGNTVVALSTCRYHADSRELLVATLP